MDIKALLKQKKSVKSSITKLLKKTEDEIRELNNVSLLVRKNRFLELRTEIKDIFNSIIPSCEDRDEETYCTEKDDILDELEAVLVSIDTQLVPPVVNSDFEARKQNSDQVSVSSQSAEVKLPTLSLPIFSGATEEWLAFSDLFEAAVSNNQNLTGAQKLQYLKGSLKSDALKIVNSLSITNDNFEIAWKLLKDRYFNKREIVSSLMKKFINITPLSGESSTQILNLIDSTKEFVRTLESLEYKIDLTTDNLLMHIILFKLDTNSRIWFERTFSTDVIPKLDELLQFLATQARSITSSTSKRNVQKKVTLVASKAQSQCPLCNKDHSLSKCESFLKLSVQKRSEFVKSNNVCFNCLTQFHGIKACKSKFRCRTCKKPHHTLLHFESVSGRGRQTSGELSNSSKLSINAPTFKPASVSNESSSKEIPDNSQTVDITSCISNVSPNVEILLCTAVIRVKDLWGNYQACRCLLDSGSQASLITSECLEKLGLRKQKANIRISCLGSADTRTNGIAQIQFIPHFPSQSSFKTEVYVVNKIVGMLPHQNLDLSYSDLFNDLTLADPMFHKSSQVDILLGIDLTLPLLKGQTLSMGEDKPFAVRSELGWVIGGKASSFSPTLHVNNIHLVSDDLIHKFWELDSVPQTHPLTSLERSCEEYFKETHSRDKDGRYIVRLPFNSCPTQLGQSKQTAIRRLFSIERHLSCDPEKYNRYRQFMNEYLKLNHMIVVPESELDKPNSYYLPHHAVQRDSSSTTKLRVVFDGSFKTSSGHSLNDCLIVGPRVQPELFQILIQFRVFQVAVCADVEKMFRQIKVHEDDVDWRNSPEDAIREYRLVTVTYGTACAPFLSTRTLRQLALDEVKNYPLASKATLCNFYVDDLLGGAGSREEAIQLVLGLGWSPSLDVVRFTVVPDQLEATYTKRGVLSQMARVFDPLGLLSPCVIFMKILLQQLWQGKFSWDQPLPDELSSIWRTFQEELHLLKRVTFPRYVLKPNAVVEVHGFCDASEKAYCAAIYIRCISIDSIRVSLLTSKTRVAPLKVQSLPRLELCSALLLANLLQATLPALTVRISETFAWSDSKITLAWLKSEPRRWQPFVANRVAQIQELTHNVHWNFVSGLENPADCGTRGILPTKLEQCDLWFNGPDWLKSSTFPNEEFEENPQLQEDMSAEAKRTSKVIMLNVVDENFKVEVFQKFSSWNKLKRIVAYCLRFVKNCSLATCQRKRSFLTTAELNEAEKCIVKFIQRDHFSMEVSYLSASKQLPSNNKIIPLTPFYDDSGIIRVGGRLKNSMLTESQKHPILLPKTDHVVNLIITDYHLKLLHAGPQLIQAALREKFWILSAQDAVRRVVRKCIPCFRNRPKLAEQI
ncbi:hypothetical protein AVEN_140205-1, partial [Araneus ventricosus]